MVLFKVSRQEERKHRSIELEINNFINKKEVLNAVGLCYIDDSFRINKKISVFVFTSQTIVFKD